MSANAAKYLLSVSDAGSHNIEVTGFSGVDAISSPYWFDIEFRISAAAQAANMAPLDTTVAKKRESRWKALTARAFLTAKERRLSWKIRITKLL
jgi:hypothetical protein